MKTASHLQMFVVVATMTVVACTEPDVFTTTKTSTGPAYVPPQEFHTTVTTWQHSYGSYYNGIISQTPDTDLSSAVLYWVRNGQRVLIEVYPDVSKTQNYEQMNDGYVWATVRGNIFVLNYIAKTPNSAPPFPFDVIIVY